MSYTSSWRTLLVVALAAFGMAVIRLSATSPEQTNTPPGPCKMRFLSEKR